MATVTDRITNIVRVDIGDEMKSRFTTDQPLLTFFKQAIRRAQGIAFEHQLPFARTSLEFTMQPGDTSYLLPPNFMAQAGVWRTDTRKPIINTTLEQWEVMQDPQEFACYNIEVSDTTTINFASSSDNDVPVKIVYFYDAFPDNMLLTTNMPWNGKLDYIICEYVNIRAFHSDRYDLSVDFGLLRDMEEKILKIYQNIEPTMGEAIGGYY